MEGDGSNPCLVPSPLPIKLGFALHLVGRILSQTPPERHSVVMTPSHRTDIA